MTGFVFSNRFDTGNFYGALIEGEAALDLQLLGNVAFVTTKASEKADYTFEEAWAANDGAIIVLGSQPSDPAQFGKIVATRLIKAGAKLIWIADPNLAWQKWNSAVFAFKASDGTQVLKQSVELALTDEQGGYGLTFAKGLSATADLENNALILAGAPTAFGRDETWFAAGEDRIQLDLANPAGPCFHFGFDIAGGDALVSDLDKLGLGFWFSTIPEESLRIAYRYPLFQGHPQHEGLSCTASITLNALLDPGLTKISASPTGIPEANFVTWFRSILGRSLTATLDGPMGMVFNKASAGGFGLSPTGRLILKFSDQSNKDAVSGISTRDRGFACGATGTEAIAMPEGQDETIACEMVPGRPSCAKIEGEDISMAADTTTSWIKLTLPQPDPPPIDELLMSYEAQPPGQGTLYDATGASAPPVSILPYFRPIPIPLPNDSTAPVMPLVPLAGLPKGSEEEPITLAVTAIGPVRKAEIDKVEAARLANGGAENRYPANITVADGDIHRAITPRGLEATFDDTGWVSVEIAKLLGTIPGNWGRLRFAGPDGIVDPLKSALMTSEQFLVVSNPEAIKRFFSDPTPTPSPPTPPPPPPTSSSSNPSAKADTPSGKSHEIEDASEEGPFRNVEPPTHTRVGLRGWEFKLGPECWNEYGTILIVKNTPVAMQDLLEDLSAWTSADQFNNDPGATSRRLLDIAQKARDAKEAGHGRLAQLLGIDPEDASHDFDFFVETVLDSPNWNGFLFLNAKIGDLPPDLAGIRAGIKPEDMYAHHIGVTQTPFTSLNDLDKRSSSMFGLIRYFDDSKIIANGTAYTFRVRELGVQFAESDIRDFRSTVDLALGTMFGQQARLADGSYPISEMIGTRHERGAGDAYSFTATDPIEIKPGPGPLQTIKLEHGEFVTKSVDENTGDVKTAFNFSGWLGFDQPKPEGSGYDILSFDILAFSKLAVTMDFNESTAQKTTYTFDISDLELVEALSEARTGSLFEGFPIELDKLVFGTGKPDAQGNMTVQLPEQPKSLPGQWYGFTQIIDMGTLSDVAGAAGLEARLLTAWGTEPNQHYVGLKFSGPNLSGIGVDFDLLSVLKLRAYSVDLLNRDEQWTLLMHGVNLSVFSKTLPPGGAFEFYIFGVPDPSGSANSLGWYGAWLADKEDKQEKVTSPILTRDLIEAAPIVKHSPRLRFRDAANTKGD
ncbi:MAG: hypothetical protein AAGK02_03385 [Pseudomonadota bacterium]